MATKHPSFVGGNEASSISGNTAMIGMMMMMMMMMMLNADGWKEVTFTICDYFDILVDFISLSLVWYTWCRYKLPFTINRQFFVVVYWHHIFLSGLF